MASLLDVLDSLNSVSDAQAQDTHELRAVVLAELASLDDRYLEEALTAVDAAESTGRIGWPNYYLGATLLSKGRNDEALARLSRVPGSFFEAQDLRWRAVHMDEMIAIAQLELGRQQEAAVLVDRVSAALASRGDEDDLAPPTALLEALLRHVNDPHPEAVRSMLAAIAGSIDLVGWVGSSMSSRVDQAVRISST